MNKVIKIKYINRSSSKLKEESKSSLKINKIISKKYPSNKPFKPSIKFDPLIKIIKQKDVKIYPQ